VVISSDHCSEPVALMVASTWKLQTM